MFTPHLILECMTKCHLDFASQTETRSSVQKQQFASSLANSSPGLPNLPESAELAPSTYAAWRIFTSTDYTLDGREVDKALSCSLYEGWRYLIFPSVLTHSIRHYLVSKWGWVVRGWTTHGNVSTVGQKHWVEIPKPKPIDRECHVILHFQHRKIHSDAQLTVSSEPSTVLVDGKMWKDVWLSMNSSLKTLPKKKVPCLSTFQ